MPTPKKGPRLGSGPAHERLMMANLATALFEHDRITTTHAKAKRLRPLAERLVTMAKRGDLHNRRRVMRTIQDGSVVHKLFTEIAPDVADREGGYTRIVKIAPRKGDNAPMSVIELVREPVPRKATVTEAERTAQNAARNSSGVAPSADTSADEAPGEEATTEQVSNSDAQTESALGEAPTQDAAAQESSSETTSQQDDSQSDSGEAGAQAASGATSDAGEGEAKA